MAFGEALLTLQRRLREEAERVFGKKHIPAKGKVRVHKLPVAAAHGRKEATWKHWQKLVRRGSPYGQVVKAKEAQKLAEQKQQVNNSPFPPVSS